MKSDKPYITKRRIVIEKFYNKDFGDDKVCGCGHAYYRHFDTYEQMYPCGCKYCSCGEWHAEETDVDREDKERYNEQWRLE